MKYFLSLGFLVAHREGVARATASRQAIRLLRHIQNAPENIKRATMASAIRRASLLVQLMIFHVRLNILQKAGKWIRTHTQRKTKGQKLTKKSFVKDDDFFDIGTEIVEEQPTDFDRYDKSKEDNSSYHSGGPVGKSFSGKKNKLKSKRNTVTPSERHAWNEHGEGKGKKRHSHTLRLFGSRSTKASNIKSDFDKPYYKNADVRQLNDLDLSRRSAV